MHTEIVSRIEQIPAADWNRLAGMDNPFVRHEFLLALERHDCVGESWGWWPQHVVAREGGRLVGAAPMYLKDNSYGELVFDGSWAEAYQRAGLPYYPKLVVAVPYTPATGARLLVDPEADAEQVTEHLIGAALEHTRRCRASSLHWLFTSEADTRRLEGHGLARRVGCQYHWSNPGYRDFQDYLDSLVSKRRKQIRRERRQALAADMEVEILDGRRASAEHWEAYHRLYRSTFDRKWGYATLSRGFFQALGATLPEAIVLVLARRHGRYVAGAFNLAGSDTLYGRHWGSDGYYPALHFELCYYQTIEHCIARGLARFEAGAQGEHKIMRGFLPVPTYSAHWMEHSGFRQAVAEFTAREQRAMQDYMRSLDEHSPFREQPASGQPDLKRPPPMS